MEKCIMVTLFFLFFSLISRLAWCEVSDFPESLSPFKALLEDAVYLGSLQSSKGGLPYVFLSGRSKQGKNTQNELAIYSVRASLKKGSVEKIVPELDSTFLYPGKILDFDTGRVVFESRAFLGRCLNKINVGVYVVFQREIIDKKRGFVNSVFIADASRSDHLEEHLMESRFPRIQETLQWVKKKECIEILGKTRRMSRFSLSLHPSKEYQDENTEGEEVEEEEGA